MGSFLNYIFNNVEVEEDNNVIKINNISSESITKIIAKKWKTSKIETFMFKKVSKRNIELYSFFALDILYVIERIINDGGYQRYGVNVKMLNSIKKELLQNTWLKTIDENITSKLDYTLLDEFIFRPLDYQEDFFNYYNTTVKRYQLKGVLLHGEPGTGKTFMSLAVSRMLYSIKTIVICPKNALHRVWEASLSGSKCIFKENQSYWLSDSLVPYNNENYIVFHYEYLSKAEEWWDVLKTNNTTIILDESHNLNELTSQRTQLFIKLCKDMESKNIILASGTPIKALGKETIPLFKVLDKRFTDNVEEVFKKMYGIDAGRCVDILKERLGLVKFYVEKKQTGLEEPEYIELSVSIPDSKEFTLPVIKEAMTSFIKTRLEYYKTNMNEYTKIFYDVLTKFREKLTNQNEINDYNEYRRSLTIVINLYNANDLKAAKLEIMYCNSYELKQIIPTLTSQEAVAFKNARSVVKYVKLKVQGECLGRILTKKRIDCHVQMVKHINFPDIINSTLKKTLIFTSFIEVASEIKNICTELKYHPLGVYGEFTSSLSETVAKFERVENANPLIATYMSLSTAVPLTMADIVIMIDMPFREYIQNQAISRVHRLGATTRVRVYKCVLNTGTIPNISSRSLDILKWSQEQVELITGVKAVEQDSSTVITNTALESLNDYWLEKCIDINFTPLSITTEKQVKNPIYNEW